MRVSLVKLVDGEAWFAPYDHSPWVRRPLRTLLDQVPLELGQVGDLEGDEEGWLFEVNDGVRVERCTLRAVGRPDDLTFEVRPGRDILELSGHGVAPNLKNKAQSLGFWRLVPCPSDSPLRGTSTTPISKNGRAESNGRRPKGMRTEPDGLNFGYATSSGVPRPTISSTRTRLCHFHRAHRQDPVPPGTIDLQRSTSRGG
jgi:hypothetical protein